MILTKHCITPRCVLFSKFTHKMNKKILQTGVCFVLGASASAFAAYLALALADPRFGDHVNHVAPIFGVAVAIVLVGGYRYLPAVFIGSVLPTAFVEADFLSILSVPLAAVLSATFARRVLLALQVDESMSRSRDGFLILFWGAVVSTLVGVLLQSVLLCAGDNGIGWGSLLPLALSNWLSASVGTIIVAPFILTWSSPVSFQLGSRRILEVLVWFAALICFGHVTFLNWAPTDTLLYPMELAIFPIMAWAAIRFGLRGASAGVLALALLAAWEMIPISGGGMHLMSQSPANVWVFVGIVSITSVCLASVMTEISRREAKIAENESRLRAFTEALPDIAFVLDESGQIFDVFAATSRISANHRIFNADRVRGKHINDLFGDDVCAGFLETIQKALTSDVVQTYEYSLQSVDVGQHWFEARVTAMAGPGEQDNRQVVWIAYDISSRKQSEAAIRQRDSILRATASANNILLTTHEFDQAIDAALFEIGKALKVDRAYIFTISGTVRDDFHNLSISHEWRSKDNCPSLKAKNSFTNAPFEQFCPGWYEAFNESGIVSIEDTQITGVEKDVLDMFHCRSILAIPMWTEGRLYGFFGVDFCHQSHEWGDSEINAVRVLATSLSGLLLIRDNEEALRGARDSADAASVAKGEFLAMMSHEIRTPMNAIIGYTDLLCQTELNEMQSEQAAIIKRSGRALLDLINNILDYSKVESRSLELESVQFDLEQVVCEALEGILPQAKDKHLTVDYEIESGVREFYLGDAHRLRQVLMNLANNAIKFTKSGSVKIFVELKKADLEARLHTLHFRVVDTGCGIPEDKFDRLFQPFSQVDSSTTRKFGGTGLGLVISQRLVERMDGRIWVESRVDEGSTFQFDICLSYPGRGSSFAGVAHRHTGNEDLLEPEFSHKHPLKLLLCEDDKDNRWVIRELLETLGYRPDVVENSEEALLQLQNRAYDAVLLDVRLPGLSGIELTSKIRSGELRIESQDQYIIAVTAFAMNEDREKCIAAGMNDYIRKPMQISELKDALVRAYERARV